MNSSFRPVILCDYLYKIHSNLKEALSNGFSNISSLYNNITIIIDRIERDQPPKIVFKGFTLEAWYNIKKKLLDLCNLLSEYLKENEQVKTQTIHSFNDSDIYQSEQQLPHLSQKLAQLQETTYISSKVYDSMLNVATYLNDYGGNCSVSDQNDVYNENLVLMQKNSQLVKDNQLLFTVMIFAMFFFFITSLFAFCTHCRAIKKSPNESRHIFSMPRTSKEVVNTNSDVISENSTHRNSDRKSISFVGLDSMYDEYDFKTGDSMSDEYDFKTGDNSHKIDDTSFVGLDSMFGEYDFKIGDSMSDEYDFKTGDSMSDEYDFKTGDNSHKIDDTLVSSITEICDELKC